MTGERNFIRENTNRILIKEFLIKKIEIIYRWDPNKINQK